ncbi:unnamed protein product, partial [Rodentolepis nana]|uniref:Tick transposon n=1 Tax=Rodentolepis nana TaxID=102285 RepID=A0A0R3THK0_RODNA
SDDISEHTRRKIIDDPGSGHKPVIASITIGSKSMTWKVPTKLSWNFKKANWPRFTNLLDNELHTSPLNFNQHPDKLSNDITNIMIRCARKTIPRGKTKHYREIKHHSRANASTSSGNQTPLQSKCAPVFRKSNTPPEQMRSPFTHPTARLLQDVVCCTQLLDYFRKSNTPPEQMCSLAFETINVNYPGDQWLQVFTEESQGNVGAGVYSELFPTLVHSSLMGHTKKTKQTLVQVSILNSSLSTQQRDTIDPPLKEK